MHENISIFENAEDSGDPFHGRKWSLVDFPPHLGIALILSKSEHIEFFLLGPARSV